MDRCKADSARQRSAASHWRTHGMRAAAALALALAAGDPAAAQVLNFRHYTAADGMPQGQVLALHQDARQYVWIGTYAGLSRFNGAEFRTWGTADGLGSNSVTAIAEDGMGRLHVGSTGSGVCTLAGSVIGCLRASDGLPHDDVLDVLVDADGSTLWLGTGRGIARVENGIVRVYPETGDAVVHRMVQDSTGTLWAGTDSGLLRGDRDGFADVQVTQLAGTAVGMLLPTRWGLLIGSGSRLFLLRNGILEPLRPPQGREPALITDAALDLGGDVWIATRAGVLHFDGERFTRFTTGNGLLFDQVNRVTIDVEGNVWFGTERGLSRLTPGPFRHYTEREGLPNPFVRAITSDVSGRLWFGTRAGLGVWESDTIRALDFTHELGDGRIYALAALPRGEMLVGTRSGLALHDGTRIRRVYGTADGLPGDAVLALLADGTGGAWIGTDRGLARWNDGVIRPVDGVPALDDLFIISMALDARGRLWLGARSGGVVLHDGTTAVTLGAAQGVTEETIWSIARAPDGAMWIGSNGDGLFRVNADDLGDIRRYNRANGLINDFIWQVQPDDAGALWLYTSRGIDRLTDAGVQHYGPGRGLLELEGAANASWRDPNGELWFGTAIGVVRYTPELEDAALTRPPIYIEDFASGTDTLPLLGARVRAGRRVLKIRFAAPAFGGESGMRYRYRLIGAEAGWSEPTAERSIGYAGLAPGQYEFQVVAIAADGGTSESPAALAFIVTPLVWQTWWFRLSGFLLVLAVAGAAVRVRTRHLQAERRRLAAVVDERTRELSVKNSALEREVAERQRAEEALRSSQQRLLEVVEHSTNMFYAHGADGELTYVSPQSRRILGCDPDEALRRYHEFVTDNPANEAGFAATQRAMETGERQPAYELELRGLDGVIRWVQVNEAPVTRDGKTVSLVGSLTDITEAKRAASERERLETQLRQAQKMEAVGRLAGGIAHDFNNLLTAVVGNTELVAAGLDPAHSLQSELMQVRHAADRAASLVSQLLAFSRQQLIRRRVLDLNCVVAESARMLQRMIGTDIELQLELATSPLWLQADQGQLDQVIMNLALNGRDAMPDGGRLRIRTEAIELDSATAGGYADNVAPGPYAALRVSDTGHGMDAETKRHVFEPFYTTREVGKGTGLGLATVYGIVTQNGGTVRIESEAGHGSTFHILLPLTAEPQDAAPGSESTQATGITAPAETQIPGDVVLVVEDEEAVRRLVCRTLARAGFRVLEAHDGTHALTVCASHPGTVDLLLTDMVMPGLNGRSVALHVAAVHPHARVLYMSGHTRDVLGSRFMLDAATEVLQKPFTPAELVQRVRDLLASPAAVACDAAAS